MSDSTAQNDLEKYELTKEAFIHQFEHLSNEAFMMITLAELVQSEIMNRCIRTGFTSAGEPKLSALRAMLLHRVSISKRIDDSNEDQ